ncbi:MAG: hypothetical protein PF503_06115 [Desulfobacula sp.]|jgi:YesN/AraC family two-component response regulator|nr:hypothetical protein [Desulfobacula sp.]
MITLTQELDLTRQYLEIYKIRMGLCLLLERLWPELKILGQAQNEIEALSLIELGKPDIEFLDIKMPGIIGITVAKKVSNAWKQPLHG